MVKKVISIATVFLMLCCMIPFGAFADDILDVCPKCGERTYETWTDFSTTVPELGFPLSGKYRHCTSCGYTYYDWNCLGFAGYKDFDNGGEGFFLDYIKNWCTKTFGQNATATKAPSGIGRKDLPGFASDDGTPSVGKDGTISLSGSYSFLGYSSYGGKSILDGWTLESKRSGYSGFNFNTYGNFYTTYSNGSVSVSGHLSSDSSAYKYFSPVMVAYYFIAPHDGYYTVFAPTASVVSSVKIYDGSYSKLGTYNAATYYSPAGNTYTKPLYSCEVYARSGSGSDYATLQESLDASTCTFGNHSKRMYFAKGAVNLVVYAINPYFEYRNNGYVYSNITLKTSTPTWNAEVFEDIDSTTINSQTNITINNNTWNGNIYTDNSTNLTYIYPQYTTINESGDTVTNISENPIIYNSETKQYYTYDTVTNNYYYITYEQPATPTPSPSPSPSPSPTPTETSSPSESPAPTPTPDPGENPTPTPTPGGGTIITPGGGGSGSGSGSSSGISGGNDEGLFGWLWDLLKDLVKAILKAIFKVLSGLLGFLIWLVERVGILLPFLPAPAIAALGAGVVLVFVIRIIRFIRG